MISRIYFSARQGAKYGLESGPLFSSERKEWVIKTEGPGEGVALGKFDSSNSIERFWQT